MTREFMELVNHEIESGINVGKDYFQKGQESMGKTLESILSLFGKKGFYWDSETGKWVSTNDPKYGGQPSILDILKGGRL